MSYPVFNPHRTVLLCSVRRVVQVLLLSLGMLNGLQVLAQSAAPALASEQQELQININEADAELIADVLLGIGPSKARAIVAYREEHGRFESLDDLKLVAGIGDVTVVNNRDRIVFE